MKRRNLAIAAVAAAALLGTTGCMSVASPAIGVLYTDVKGPLDAEGKIGSKEGKACAESILGLVARGDASIEAAAKEGGITTITTVSHHTTNMVGVIGKFCTIVRGS